MDFYVDKIKAAVTKVEQYQHSVLTRIFHRKSITTDHEISELTAMLARIFHSKPIPTCGRSMPTALDLNFDWGGMRHTATASKLFVRLVSMVLALRLTTIYHEIFGLGMRNTKRHYRSLSKAMLLHEVTFCLPAPCIPHLAQQKQQSHSIILPELEYSVFYTWIYQTWHHLTQAGISCKLSDQLPNEGIIVTLGGTLPPFFRKKTLSKNLFLVDVVADNTPFVDAPLHLIQNKKKAQQTKHALYLPHWPQPHLIPRHPERKNRFENIGFFGDDKNLAPELQTHRWQERLKKELGLHFKIKKLEEWHNYSDVDCVIAIRDFSKKTHLNKPGTKLYNAWLAGVPFVGGNDSAYRGDGHPGKNYLLATSLEKTFQHLRQLKEDEAFRIKLVREGKKSATNFTHQAILEHWKKVVIEIIPKLVMKRCQE